MRMRLGWAAIVMGAAALQAQGPEAIERLNRVVPAAMEKGGVPGLSIALIGEGKTVWVHGFGVKDRRTGEPVGTDTIFEAASLSKPVFAYGVLKLVDQGKIDLDAPLASYLDKPYVADARAGKITARHVLSHRTGFPNWRQGKNLTMYFAPGDRFSYSGEGYIYLQRVVEEITGKRLEVYLDEAVFQPLGMTHSGFVWRPAFDALAATGHDAKGRPEERGKPREAGAASSLNTTAGDYARFVNAILAGEGLSAAMLREMETPGVAVDPGCQICIQQEPKELSKTLFWGLGWGLQRGPEGLMLWHWGDNGAFKAFVMADAGRKSGVVLFANGQRALEVAKPIIDTALGVDSQAFGWLN